MERGRESLLVRPRSVRRLAATLALVVTGSAAAAGWGTWREYPDMSHAPDPASSPGWSEERLEDVWTKLRGFRSQEDGAYFLADAGDLRLHEGERLVVYYRGGGRQGIAGNAEVTDVAEDGVALLRVRLAFLMQYFDHDPWRGWRRRHAWREGYEPSRMRYFVSRRNLAARPEDELRALREGDLYRGMHATDVLRAWGAPASRGAHGFAHGRVEQWVYQIDPRRRSYVYVDADTAEVTGFHGGHLYRYPEGL